MHAVVKRPASLRSTCRVCLPWLARLSTNAAHDVKTEDAYRADCAYPVW
jgi:hypothetical protein